VGIDRIGDGGIGTACLMLVDHRGAFAVVSHAGYQVAEPGTANGGEVVASVAQVVKVQALGLERAGQKTPDRRTAYGPPPLIKSAVPFARGDRLGEGSRRRSRITGCGSE
jgi:hypothetical protein